MLVAIRECLGLLGPRDRVKLLLATLGQVSTSLLDLIGVVLLGAVGALAAALLQSQPAPPVIAQALDYAGLADVTSAEALIWLSGIAALLLITRSLASALITRRIFRFLANRQAVVSSDLARQLMTQSLTFIHQWSSQRLSYSLVQGAAAATLGVLGQAVIVVSELALLLLLGTALFVADPLVALASFLFFCTVALGLQMLLGNWAARAGTTMAQADVESLDSIQEAVASFREISVAGRREHYANRIRALRWQAASVAADLQFVGALPKYVFEVAFVFGGIVLAAVLFATQPTTEAVGTLSLFLAASSRIMPAIIRLQGASLTLRNASGAAVSTLDLSAHLQRQAAPEDSGVSHGKANVIRRNQGVALQISGWEGFRPEVSMRSVRFSYPGTTQPAIDDVSLRAEPGTSVALVGSSGAGKSTLADLILGVLQPDSGSVTLGGLSPEIAIDLWPGAIGYVPQDVNLANGTIRENVCLGLPHEAIDDDLVWEALVRARLDEVLLAQREGLDTWVGERGIKLSGGQRQRLGIARALYTQPSLLVLDEATSALDAETELAIGRTIQDLEGRVTTFIIAHRLSTVRNANLVAYLSQGRLVAQGAFADVRRDVPEFDRQANIMGLH